MPYAAETSTAVEGLVTVDGHTFPLRSASIKSRAQGGLAFTTLRQEFANPHAEPLEVLYTMPLPADGAVVGYTFRLGERVVRGEIEPREKARQDYRRALMEGKTAGLLEQERADTFHQMLGNLPAATSVTVEIEVLHPLAFLPGVGGAAANWEWRFPTVVSVRYGDAQELSAPRSTPGGEGGIPARVTAELIVGEGPWLVAEPQRMDRDLVFRWAATTAEVDAHVVEGPGLPGDDGRYAMIVVTPPSAPATVRPRDLTILLDASGSMDGPPLEKAKGVIGAVLDSLTEADRLEILAFSTRVVPLTALARASRAGVDDARRKLAALRAGGGTEMASAVVDALDRTGSSEAQRQVLLITDGCVSFEKKVADRIQKHMPEGTRLHAVGIGDSPNRTLTRLAARAGRGIELLVGFADDPAVAAERLVRGTVAPVLTEVTIVGSGYLGFAPERPRDVFAGEPLSLLVHVAPGGGELEVSGRLAGSDERWSRRFPIGARAVLDGPAIPLGAAYARERVEDMEAREYPDDGAIEAAGLRHRIVTRLTSLVAISEEPTVDPRDPRRRERLAVELPYGVSAEGVGLGDSGSRGIFRRRGVEFLGHDLITPGARRHRAEEGEPEGTLADPGLAGPPRGIRDRIVDYFRRRAHREVRRLLKGRILFFEGDRLVLEFESPEEGIRLPGADPRISVELDDLSVIEARVNEKDSTQPGHHGSGLTLRLALKLDRTPTAGRTPTSVSWALDRGGVAQVDLA